MPFLKKLHVSNFRNIETAELILHPKTNIIFGENGAGKSSVLEAINVLALGRSFRTRKFRTLIKEDAPDLVVFGSVSAENLVESNLGVQRQRSGQSVLRVDGKNIHTTSELAGYLPLLVVNAQSFQLLEGSAKQRRQFFDWLVFHVKHDYGNLWKRYSTCIKQRNSLLRRDKITYSDLLPWDKEITQVSQGIEECRNDTFSVFKKEFSEILLECNLDKNLQLEYVSGWKAEKDPQQQLEESFHRDLSLGYTSIGAHKAELKVVIGKTPAIEILSRGQQKTLIAAMFIAEARVYQTIKQKKPLFLIDDMPAELDSGHQKLLCHWLKDLDTQIFITSIEKNPVLEFWSDSETKVFHVKHGQIAEISLN